MRNISMLTDLYQLTMMYGYYKSNCHKKQVVFDLFFRKNTGESSFAIMAGLQQAIDYLLNLKFTEEDIDYLRSLKLFDEDFLNLLKEIRFTGELYAIPEGSVVFPSEPLLRVKGPILEAQLVETALLNIVNFQTLIATKARRIVNAAQNDAVIEFGLRRAQGPDAGIYGARAAVIGGCIGTSNVLAGQLFGIPVKGTHAHSWVMSFSNELDAFRAYAKTFPDSCLLLVDTYDTLKSGVPNAITVFKELKADGHKPVGIRLDSGDLAYLSKKARKMLDDAGLQETKIFASNDLDEVIIRDLKAQGARIDVWGVGTQLITSADCPSLGGVYKLAAEYSDGRYIPKMKLSDNINKMTTPGYKKVVRLYGKDSGKALADLICLDDEKIDDTKPLRIYHSTEPWKTKVINNFETRDMLEEIIIDGQLVYKEPTFEQIIQYARQEIDTLWDEYKRPYNPHIYKVDLSDKVYEVKQQLMKNLLADN